MKPTWDQYFLNMAAIASQRATCDRKKVGAVLVVDHHMIATGYNGAPRGWPSCDIAGHEMAWIGGGKVIEAARIIANADDNSVVLEDERNALTATSRPAPLAVKMLRDAFAAEEPRQSCIRTIHAEENAVIQAARTGAKVLGATLYTTASCCYDCFKMLMNVGVSRIVYGEEYVSARSNGQSIPELAMRFGITMERGGLTPLARDAPTPFATALLATATATVTASVSPEYEVRKSGWGFSVLRNGVMVKILDTQEEAEAYVVACRP